MGCLKLNRSFVINNDPECGHLILLKSYNYIQLKIKLDNIENEYTCSV